MKKLFFLLCIISNFHLLAESSGQDKGNGGFLYSRTSKKLLDFARATLLNELDFVLNERSELKYISHSCQKEIHLSNLKVKIFELTYSYESESWGINPEGRNEKKYFYINQDNMIEATELFFASFVDTYNRYAQENDVLKKEMILEPIRLGIIHEALHLFDYNEIEARECSNEIIKVIESYDANKLKRLQIQTRLDNDHILENFLITSECLTEKNLENIQILNSFPEDISGRIYYNMAGRRVLMCLTNKLSKLVKKDPSDSIGVIISFLGLSLKKPNRIIDVAHYLNSAIKFPFSKELPKKL
jgi:hypothetical protein